MASFRLEPPESFDFSKPDGWNRWKRRFDQFRVASGLVNEDDAKQVSTLLYCLGEGAEDTLSSTNISRKDRESYGAVVKKLDDYFGVRRNVIFECARFNRRDQLEGETADEYIATLFSLADNCEYGGLKDELIRDRLVIEQIQVHSENEEEGFFVDIIGKRLDKAWKLTSSWEQHLSISHQKSYKALETNLLTNIPLPLRNKVKEELERMTKLGVISKVETPTEWCAGMVVVPKKSSGSIRICVDLRPLNENVMRENFPLPKVDEILAQLAGARVFSKLDANMGFWQIPLSPECRSLTTFITPLGRFHFNKLPFGVSCASELFQRRMAVILEGLEGVLCLVDDVLVFGSDQQEHDRRLRVVLERLNKARVTLNAEKCAFSRKEIKFLGHVVNHRGVHPDPDKTMAFQMMPKPKDVSEL
eukprot:Em0001g1217a